MGRVPLKFVHTITSRKSAELVIVIVDVAATSCSGHSFTPFTALGVNTDGNLRVCRGRRAGSVGRGRWGPGRGGGGGEAAWGRARWRRGGREVVGEQASARVLLFQLQPSSNSDLKPLLSS